MLRWMFLVAYFDLHNENIIQAFVKGVYKILNIYKKTVKKHKNNKKITNYYKYLAGNYGYNNNTL